MRENVSKLKRSLLITALLFSAVLLIVAVVGAMAGMEAEQRQPQSSAWDTVFTETFESPITSTWTVSDENGATDGEYYWGTTSYTASQGTQSAWAVGGGADGSTLVAGTDNYPPNVLSHLTRGPETISGTSRARLTFSYWLQTEAGLDVMQVLVSTDGSSFTPLETYSGDSNGWQSATLSLDEYVGEEQLWIDFFFSSNGATGGVGAFIDDIVLETLVEQQKYLPIVRHDPTATPTSTPTPTPSPTPPPWYYFDDFSDPGSGWPVVDNTHVPNDCFRWFYEDGAYKVNICDDRTDVKVSPGVPLPNGDYEIEVDARFREAGGWWTSYGILFDAKDEPDPNKPDLGDYYMLWVLWEGNNKHSWALLRDIPGNQINVTGWQSLSSSVYDYGNNGTAWNTWRIVRTEDDITIYVNDRRVGNISEDRPRTNNQILFGVYASTYETNSTKAGFDNYLVNTLSGPTAPWQGMPQPFYSSSKTEELRPLLPRITE